MKSARGTTPLDPRRDRNDTREVAHEQARTATLERATGESKVRLSLDLDGTGQGRSPPGWGSTTTC